MQKIVDIEKCSGCHACFNICPKDCITMQENTEGFLYPVIDEELCVDCGMCKKACPVLSEYEGNPVGKAYACINNKEETRMKSSSGGVFSLLAEYILNRGGVVFGAAFDEDLTVHHIEITDIDNLGKLRGSKYLQSRIENTYRKVKERLDTGVSVLFTGVPCQISGLKSYLGREYSNLYVQDLICYGVPSPMVWKKYLQFQEKRNNGKVQKSSFRHKTDSWKEYSVVLNFDSVEYTEVFWKDSYMKSFLNGLCLRPSCYNCHSKSVERQSDITLADFWGIEHVCPEFFDDKGTSLVLVNSEKGKQLFDAVSSGMRYKEVSVDDALKFNPAAFRSARKPKNRTQFMKLVNEVPFDKAVKKCVKKSFLARCFGLAKRVIRKVIK